MQRLLQSIVWLGVGLFVIIAVGCGENSSANKGTISANQGKDSSSSGGERRIIILTNGDSPFWDACRAGLQEAQKDLKLQEAGLQAVLDVNNNTPQGQINKLRQYASQSDIAAVGISAVDAANQRVAELMRELRQKGIPIVTLDSDVDREKMRDARFAYLGTDNYAAGVEMGRCARNLRPQGGEYVTFVGRTGAQNAIGRINGFKEGAGEKFKQLDSMADNTDRTRARENVRNAMINHPGLNALVGIWSYNAPAIIDVVREKQNRQKYAVVVFDAEPNTIKGMAEGDVDALVVQNPFQMGYQGVRLMKALVENDQATVKEMLPNGGDIYDTGLKVVVPDEDSPLKADMFDKKTEFLKLSEFRKWLEKYRLSES
jgi:ribose transport system substrate-binding protein